MKADEDREFGELLRSAGPDASPPAGARERVRRQLLARLDLGSGAPAPGRGGGRRGARFWALRTAPAAAAVLAALVAWWLLAGGVQTASADFAEVLRRVRRVTSAAFDIVVTVPGREPLRARRQVAYPHRHRTTWPDGKVHVFNGAEQTGMVLRPWIKQAVLTPARVDPEGPDPLSELRRADVSAGRHVGRETVAGRAAVVYEVARPQGPMRVWVEPDGELPLRIEARSASRGGGEVIMVLENFAWNRPMADALFAVVPPAGYAVERPLRDVSEASLIGLLRTCAELGGGAFPARLDAPTVVRLIMASRPAEDVTYVPEDVTPGFMDWGAEAEAAYRACRRGLAFIEKVSGNDSWRYTGGGVRLGDAAAVVCRWRPEGSTTYRVVTGELRVVDAAADDLPARAENPSREGPPAK